MTTKIENNKFFADYVPKSKSFWNGSEVYQVLYGKSVEDEKYYLYIVLAVVSK